jgi:hypothetical protein
MPDLLQLVLLRPNHTTFPHSWTGRDHLEWSICVI